MHYKGSWFLLRMHGEEIAEIEGGAEKEIEDGTYLIQAQDTTVKIQIKTSGLHYDRSSHFTEIWYGRCPVQELLDSLEPKLLAKTLRTIDLLEMNGPLLCEPYSKPLENGIFELRTKQGSDITRVLYFFIVGKKAVLTNGFIKKSQKTPKAEKELAKKYKADYERRYGNE